MGSADPGLAPADLERRFGGLRRLYGDAGYARLRAARIAVVGVGGVGSWAAEALARSGVAGLTLIDLDHVSESNINRQVQALGATLGAAKVDALAQRIADIHPGCVVTRRDAFVAPDNWPGLLVEPVDAVLDACDDFRAKLVLATWTLADPRQRLVVCGAAGGKRKPQAIDVADLAQATTTPCSPRCASGCAKPAPRRAQVRAGWPACTRAKACARRWPATPSAPATAASTATATDRA